MVLSWDEVAGLVVEALSPEERSDAAVYLDERVLPAGSDIDVGRHPMSVRRPSAVAFVDGEPKANWSHRCRYLVVDLEDGSLQSIEARFPPFLHGPSPTLRLIWRGASVPDWALAVPEGPTPGR